MSKKIDPVEVSGNQLKLVLDIRGTAFQRRVWQALREIPRYEVHLDRKFERMLTMAGASQRAAASDRRELIRLAKRRRAGHQASRDLSSGRRQVLTEYCGRCCAMNRCYMRGDTADHRY